MAARLSAPTQSHNETPEATRLVDRATPVTARLVGCSVVLDGRSSMVGSDTADDDRAQAARRPLMTGALPLASGLPSPSNTVPSRATDTRPTNADRRADEVRSTARLGQRTYHDPGR
jgi:hypothetical protein